VKVCDEHPHDKSLTDKSSGKNGIRDKNAKEPAVAYHEQDSDKGRWTGLQQKGQNRSKKGERKNSVENCSVLQWRVANPTHAVGIIGKVPSQAFGVSKLRGAAAPTGRDHGVGAIIAKAIPALH
jgi:hypothetical protein